MRKAAICREPWPRDPTGSPEQKAWVAWLQPVPAGSERSPWPAAVTLTTAWCRSSGLCPRSTWLFPAINNSSGLTWKHHCLSGAFPAFLNYITPPHPTPGDPLPLHLLLCIGWLVFITMCHHPHYSLGPRPMLRSSRDHKLCRARTGVRFVTIESPKTQRGARHAVGFQ